MAILSSRGTNFGEVVSSQFNVGLQQRFVFGQSTPGGGEFHDRVAPATPRTGSGIALLRRAGQRAEPLQLPREPAGLASAWHLFVVRHPRRDELKKHLEANGIGCALHYPLPLHLQKAYAHLGHQPGDFPVAEKAARECLSLPNIPELTGAQIQRVVEVIHNFFR